jgi:hypothetical protein
MLAHQKKKKKKTHTHTMFEAGAEFEQNFDNNEKNKEHLRTSVLIQDY